MSDHPDNEVNPTVDDLVVSGVQENAAKATPEEEIAAALARDFETGQMTAEQVADALARETSSTATRKTPLRAIIRGLEAEPEGEAYVVIEPTVQILRGLPAFDLAKVVVAIPIYGDTQDLRALASKLDMETPLGIRAAGYLAGPKPGKVEPLVPPPTPVKRMPSWKSKEIITGNSPWSAFGIDLPPPTYPSASKKKGQADG